MESAGRIKYVHVILICLGVTFPAVHVAVTFGVGEFTITRFPPIVCLPNNEDATFYSIVLPVSILMATGVSLLVVVFYELLKVRLFAIAHNIAEIIMTAMLLKVYDWLFTDNERQGLDCSSKGLDPPVLLRGSWRHGPLQLHCRLTESI